MRIGVPKERASGERRVALVPETVDRLVKSGFEVVVETGAGDAALFPDAAYTAATIGDQESVWQSDIVVKVQPPVDAELQHVRAGQVVLGFLSPLDQPAMIEQLASRGATALSMELVPRISRAQKMDALSAMASLGGYKAVLLAAHTLPKLFPLMTTAAGTIKPANVLVLGAGVAGLQAIATAKRLGARVAGYDIRPAVKEEVESLGAGFLELQLETQDAQTEGGYAKELAQEIQQRQPELLRPHIANADVVITTALIPGRPAPLLITEDAVQDMKPGSIVIDMAAPNGGNCAITKPDETVTTEGGGVVLGPTNLPSEMAVQASELYARTLFALIDEFAEDGEFTPNFDDEIFAGACVAHDGEVLNERVKGLLAA
ncbi:MAG: Re/Si-specific NAD(P)(+) transhydrogenase subunit alpha [Bacteroidetes bacterium]|jgi:NAD(P) transhydrogenase subunit alpha|nr:Re/Si-specific NAD(P)(+) transhydrogenase subunit alpha [Bacteroidota bacterium]